MEGLDPNYATRTAMPTPAPCQDMSSEPTDCMGVAHTCFLSSAAFSFSAFFAAFSTLSFLPKVSPSTDREV